MTETLHPIQLPDFAIGTKLDPKRLADPYTRGLVVRSCIARLMEVVGKLRKRDYVARTPGDMTMIGNHNKARIRTMLRVLDEAHSAEIVGIHPRHVHLVGDAANQCYLVERYGGIEYDYQILYRANIDGQELAFAPDIATHNRFRIEDALLDYPAAPADIDTSALPTGIDGLDESTFFLQLAPATEFVAFWYGEPERYRHAPAHIRMNKVHLDPADTHFLPEPTKNNPAPVELDREVLCGWRFTTKLGGYPWRVARNAAEAIGMATAEAERIDRSRRNDEPRLMEVIDQKRFLRRRSRKEITDAMLADIRRRKAEETNNKPS